MHSLRWYSFGIKARFCITTDNLSKEAWTKNVQASLFIQGLLSPLMLQYIHMPALFRLRCIFACSLE